MVALISEKYSTRSFPSRGYDVLLAGRGERISSVELGKNGYVGRVSERCGVDLISAIELKLKDSSFKNISDGHVREGYSEKKWEGVFHGVNIEIKQNYTKSGLLSGAEVRLKYAPADSNSDVVRDVILSFGLVKVDA